MVTRFIHIGDVHLLHGHPRNADRLQSLDQIVNEAACLERLGAILIPGDLYHQRSTVDDRNALSLRLQQLASLAPVVLVRGNHDAPGDLDILSKLKARWPIYVVTRPMVLQVPLAGGETAAIACVPYPDKNGLVAAAVAPGDIVPTAGQLLDVIFMQLAHELSLAAVAGCIPLFFGHVNVRGSIASTGQPQIGMEIEVDVAMLERLPAVYCGLSHIHKAQEIGRGVYAGSIAAMDYGEREPKSYNIIEAVRDGSEWTATWTAEPIFTPPMFHVEGDLARDGFTLAAGTDAETKHRYHAGDWAGCDVRCRYTYLASEKSVLNEQLVRDQFPDALRLKVEAVAIADRELRAPEVAAARTLPEKLAAYRKEPTLAPSMAEKVDALETHTTEQLLAMVAETLAAIERAREAMVAA